MKLLFAIVLITVLSQAIGFRFGTLYNGNEQYTGSNLDVSLQPPKYSFDNPLASATNFDYNRRRYYSQSPEGNARILHYSNEQNGNGDYKYSYETENNIRAEQSAQNINGENVVRGSYSYVGPDGQTYTVNYIADRFGYRASGAHLPTQPDQVAPILRRNYYAPEREIYETSSPFPNYVQPNNRYTAPFPSQNVVVVDTPGRFVSPPYRNFDNFISSTPAAAVQPIVYTTTGRPFVTSTTPRFF